MSDPHSMAGPGAPRRIVSFARTDGRALARHHRVAERDGSAFVVDVPRGMTSTSVAPGGRLDHHAVFGRDAPLVVEIGIGVGDALVHAAGEQPDVDFLGVDVYRPGMARTLALILQRGLTNIRLVRGDGVDALEHWVEPHTAREVWTFFPDPWPKLRHHKRRLVDAEFAMLVATTLRPGGTWRLATDWAPYARQMRDVIRDCPTLLNPHDVPRQGGEPRGELGGLAPRFEGRPATKFERKGTAAGRTVHDLTAHSRGE